MRDIAIDLKPGALPVNTFVVYGPTRTGKTEFGATFPRPLVIADITEGGFSTISNMDRAKWFEPDVEPIIKGVENMNDIAALMPWIRGEIARKRVMSIVFDAFTFYCDFYLARLIKAQTDAGKSVDNRQAYGSLGIHLRELRSNLHSLGTNVLWSCLAKHPDVDNPTGAPLIPGQQADKFSAGVDFLFHSRLEKVQGEDNALIDQYELRTRQYGKYIAGNRLGTKASSVPDPFVGTYSDLLLWLGYDLDAVHAAMPKIGPAQAATQLAAGSAAAKPAVASKGPTVITRPAPKAIQPSAGNNEAPRGAVK